MCGSRDCLVSTFQLERRKQCVQLACPRVQAYTKSSAHTRHVMSYELEASRLRSNGLHLERGEASVNPMHTRSSAAFSPDSLYPLDGKLVSSELVDLTDLGLRRSGLGLP